MALRTNTDQASVDSFHALGAMGGPKSGTILASGDYHAADPAPAEFGLGPGASQLGILVNISAISGAGATVTVNIEGWDPAAQAWFTILTSAGLTATGATLLRIGPSNTIAANVANQSPLFQTMRVRPVKSGTTTTLNYSISGHVTN